MRNLYFLLCFLISQSYATSAQSNRGVKVGNTTANTSTKRTALLIGNASYKAAGTLRNPINDVKAMTAALKELSFEVVNQTNLGQEAMEQVINDWGKTLPNYGVALFYYAGHGAEVGGINYLLPIDATPQNQAQVKRQAPAVDMVLEWMEEAHVKTNIVLLDACRDNPFSRSWSRSSNEGGLANMTAPAGTFVGFAASPGRKAADGERSNGLYTEAILKAITLPNLTIDQVFNRVNNYVRQQSGGVQVPFKNSSLEDDFYFSVTSNSILAASVEESPSNKNKPPSVVPKSTRVNHVANSSMTKSSILRKREVIMPISWGEPDYILKIGTRPGLKFDVDMVEVKAGSRVKLIFTNSDDMLHNLVITKPNTANGVGDAAFKLSLNGPKMNYVPMSANVLYHTNILQPETSETIYFLAPDVPGDYQFVCTFPGHSSIMQGTLKVVE